MATNFTALYDACVLYPAPLRDLLMQLATTGLFHARWTAEIHKEWIRAVLKSRPDLTRAQLERTRKLMDAHAPDCLVTRYESLVPGIKLPDPNDRHVLAAAIRGRANVIVTYNLTDFPTMALETHKIEAKHPDDFIRHLIDLEPRVVCAAAKAHRERLKSPRYEVEQYLAILSRQRLFKTVAFLAKNRLLI